MCKRYDLISFKLLKCIIHYITTFSFKVRFRDELWIDSGDWWNVFIERFHQKETKVDLLLQHWKFYLY